MILLPFSLLYKLSQHSSDVFQTKINLFLFFRNLLFTFLLSQHQKYNRNSSIILAQIFHNIISEYQMMMDDTSMPVDLYFAGRNLKDLDFFSKSDPFLKFSLQKSFHGNIESAGRTETVKNSVNPNWKEKISIRYYFQMKQPVKIEVYDEDSQKNSDFIGFVETTIGNIMGSHQQTMVIDITDMQKKKKTGKVIIRAQKVEQSSHSLKMKWKGGKIANVDSYFDFWDKSDPYLKFLKVRQDNTFIEVTKTEVLFDNQEPNWKPIAIPASKLLDMSNQLSSFKVECWDHEDKQGQHQFIGQTFIQSQMLKTQKPPLQFKLFNPKIKKPGKLILQNFELVPTPNFIDYLKSGLQLNLVTALDFTASNGTPSSSNSLHYGGNGPTQYQQVLNSIWEIVSNYDTDKRIPAFGFGAKPHFPNLNQNTVNHCFPLNGNHQNPQINGFGQLMETYVNALNNMELSGPTYFTPLLKEAFNAANGIKNSYTYQILLILTDGQIHDMATTKDIIVQNANLPCSIVIVGIGNANFENMQVLDGDGGLIGSTGKKCPRDIVQFVPYQKFGGNAQLLTQQLLRQIPNQVTQYFQHIGRLPQPQQKMSMEELAPSGNNKNATNVIFDQFKQ